MSSKAEEGKWIVKGVVSASQCFSCLNKIEHKLKGRRVLILCKDNCNYIKK